MSLNILTLKIIILLTLFLRYFLFSFFFVVFFCVFVICVLLCSWPYGCSASTLVIKNLTGLL
jgi:hypothetical protein